MKCEVNFVKPFNTLEDAKDFCRNRDADYDLTTIYTIRKLQLDDKYVVDAIELERKYDLDQLIDMVEIVMCEKDYYYCYMYFSRLNIFGNRTMYCVALDESY